MRNFLGFFSLTVGSQVFLIANQLVLLPLQLRVWGTGLTANWFVVMAIANLAMVGDLGLRCAGHAQLLSSVRTGDVNAEREFRQIWALTRVLITGLTVILLAAQWLWGGTSPLLVFALTTSVALDALVGVRGVWFDTLGHFNRVEVLYFGMIAARVTTSVVALSVFRISSAELGCVFLSTSGGLLVAHAYLLAEPRSLAFFSSGFRDLRWGSLRVVGLVVTEPAANWIRISLPVVVFASLAPPAFITTYVAIRAIFGAARQVTSQLARYASIAYAQTIVGSKTRADQFAIRAILASTAVGLGTSAAMIVDNGRLLRLWLTAANVRTEQLIILSFALVSIAFGGQVMVHIMVRLGDLANVAKRQYAYLGISGFLASMAYLSIVSVSAYLLLLAAQELILAGLFLFVLGRKIACVSVYVFAIAFIVVSALWTARTIDVWGIFSATSLAAWSASAAIAAIAAGSAIMGLLALKPVRSVL